MSNVDTNITSFFDTYQTANNDFNLEVIGSCYGDTFLFGQPEGINAVKKEDFLKFLPKRKELSRMSGLKSSTIMSLEELTIDDHYIQVKVVWKMEYEKDDKTIEDTNTATYILYKKEDTFHIVVQIDHQDLMKKLQDLGLLPVIKPE